MCDLQHQNGVCQLWVHQLLGGDERGTCVFAFKVCSEVRMLVGEVEYHRQMMETMKRRVTGQGLEE